MTALHWPESAGSQDMGMEWTVFLPNTCQELTLLLIPVPVSQSPGWRGKESLFCQPPGKWHWVIAAVGSQEPSQWA